MLIFCRKLIHGSIGLAVLLICPWAAAEPQETTRYSYYTVSGNNILAIHNALVRRGPLFGHDKAYAITTAQTKQDGVLIQEKQCRMTNYKIKLSFAIKLPKLRSEKSLTVEEARLWSSFSQYLAEHEGKHKTIWMTCARQLETEVMRIRTKNCKDFVTLANQIWNKKREQCEQQHNAYDQAEQRNILRQPFMRHVMSAANAKPPHSKRR